METILVLSPHLDDAVLSLGGMMAESVKAGRSVVVYNLFCAPYHGPLSAVAQRVHEGWGDPEDITNVRLEEDRCALEIIGAQQIIGDTRDLIYRQSVQGDWLYANMEDIQGERNPEDNALVSAYFRKLTTIFPNDHLEVLAPLGIGAHIDHLLAYDIGYLLSQNGYSVRFYEDFPYAMREDYRKARMAQIKGLKNDKLREFELSSLNKKVLALRCYHSQIPSLFGSNEKMEEAIRDYALKLSGSRDWGGERLWVIKE